MTSPFVYIERRYSVGRRLLSWQNKAPYQIEEFYKSYKRDSHKQTKLSSDFSKQCRVLRIEKRLILSVHLYTPAIMSTFTHTVLLSTQVYKWVPANLMLGVTLRWTSILTEGIRNSSSRFILLKPKIKLLSDGPVTSYADFAFYLTFN